MVRLCSLAFLLSAIVVATSMPARAQERYRGASDNPVGPTVSPYLNLLNRDQFGITNYQSLVRPLVQQGNAINRQGNELSRLQQQMPRPRSGGIGGYGSATGHVTFFMNYTHYYAVPQQR